MEIINDIQVKLMQIEAYRKMKIADADIFLAGALNSSIDSGSDVASFDIVHGLRSVSSTLS